MSVYEGLVHDDGDDARWAFGTGFHDPLEGVEAPPATPELADWCLALGDDALVMSHRLQEWVARAPELEEEVALANIALDLLGQARLLLARTGRSEDELAFGREPAEFRCVRLVQAGQGDFAHLVVRLLLFSVWRLALLEHLTGAADPVLAAIAAKGVKEVAFHRDHAARWVVALGDGTPYSRQRTDLALARLWPHVAGLFLPGGPHSPDPVALRADFDAVLGPVLAAATLEVPDVPGDARPRGVHLPELAPLVTELQSVARAHPGATW